jgi:DNA repair protein RadC
MGRSSSASSSVRAFGAQNEYSDRPYGLRPNAILADVHGQRRAANIDNFAGSERAHERQQGLLARLVGAVEPEHAEQLAGSLLERFGSLGSVFSAPHSSIASHIGHSAVATMLALVKSAVLEGIREDLSRAVFDLSDANLLNYIVGIMQGQDEECLHAAFLDSRGRHLGDELVARGSWSQISVRMRPLLRKAMEFNCAKLVLFHNHPSGDCRPSTVDIEFTLHARSVAAALGIELVDHLVVSGTSVFSMQRAGMLP